MWKYVQQRGGLKPVLQDLAAQSLIRTDGKLVGTDKFGNQYWENKDAAQLRDRWVVFAQKDPDPTTVPGEWHQWLHHVGDAPPAVVEAERKFFQTPHTPNATGQVFTAPGQTYTPHNFLFNKSYGQNYTSTPITEQWQPAVKKADSTSKK